MAIKYEKQEPTYRPDIRNLHAAQARTLEQEKYNLKEYVYPIDMLSEASGPGESKNYVVFYINVAEDSKLAKNANNADMFVDKSDPRFLRSIRDKNYTQATAAASSGAVAGVGTVIAGGSLAALVPGSQMFQMAKAATAATALGAASAAVATNQAGDLTRKQKRLKSAIVLHIPNQVSIGYGVQYSDEDTDLFQMGTSVVDIVKDAITNKKLPTIDNLKTLGGAGASLAMRVAPGKDALSNLTGQAINPKKEQIFRGVNFRTFQMNYEFFPRSAEEAKICLDIIYQFKYHMHPEFKGDGEFLYLYPSEFDIQYYRGTKENTKLHRHTSCVLTEMNVNYTPNGVFTTFEDGTPTQINITLTFKELMQPTKESISDFGL